MRSRIEALQHRLERAQSELAEFDSHPAMLIYETQRTHIYKDVEDPALRSLELRRLDADHSDLLRIRVDLLAQRTRAELDLEELKAK